MSNVECGKRLVFFRIPHSTFRILYFLWWYRSSRQYSYDAVGNPVKRLDANGHTLRYTYDALNRLTRVQYPKGSDVTFVYDDLSRRTSMTDGTGTTTYQYDDAGRLTSVTSPGSKMVSYEYDMAGRRVKLTDPDSGVTSYVYDLAHRLTSLKDPQNLTTSYTYDNADRLTQGVLGNSAKALYTYDNADRLTQVENRKSDDTVLNRFTYLLDAVGNRTKLTEANGDTTDYGYDNVYQLLSEVKKNSGGSTLYSYVYTYDNVGNRMTMTTGGQQTSYTYDANNRVLTAGDVNYGYDANGNTVSKTGPVTYLYDDENHLVKVTYADGSKNWFTYDGDGIRFSKRDSAGPVRFVYDGSSVLQEVSNVTGSTIADYTRRGEGLLKQRRSAGDRWYLFDGLGSTRALTNSAQTVTDTYACEAFGNILTSTGSTTNSYQYIGSWGYYAENDSGLTLLAARYYDSNVGRFVSKDPVPTLNPYVYCLDNPLTMIDPSGLTPEWLLSITGMGAALGQSIVEGTLVSTLRGIGSGLHRSGSLPEWKRHDNVLVFNNAKLQRVPFELRGGEGFGGRTVSLDQAAIARSRAWSGVAEVYGHEYQHVIDSAAQGGDFVFSLWLYDLAGYCQAWLGKDPYKDNPYEVRARKAQTGLVSPVRPSIWNWSELGLLSGLLTGTYRFGLVARW